MNTTKKKLADALRASLNAWDGEEDSVRAEHREVIELARAALAEHDAAKAAPAYDPNPERSRLIAAIEDAEDREDERDARRDLARYDAATVQSVYERKGQYAAHDRALALGYTDEIRCEGCDTDTPTIAGDCAICGATKKGASA